MVLLRLTLCCERNRRHRNSFPVAKLRLDNVIAPG